MAASSTSVPQQDAVAPAVPAHLENVDELTELISTGDLAQPDRLNIEAIPAIAAETDRVAEEREVILLSLSLLALFVITFVGYLVLATAHLL